MKKTLHLITLALFTISGFSQTITNGSDLNPSAGDSYTDNSTTYIAPGSAGASQTWNFSTLSSSGSVTTNVSTSSTNGSNMLLNNGSAQAYYNMSNTSQEVKQIFASSTTYTYTNGEKILQFPLIYNTTYTDNFRANFMSSGLYPATRSGSNTVKMDGYGTLTLPGQTITNVVRVRLQETYSDTISFPAPTPTFIINYTSDIYTWYKAGFKSPLLSMSTLTINGTPSSFGVYTNATDVSLNEITEVKEVKILGNPFTDIINFSVETTSSLDIEYQIVDVTGSVVYSTNNASLTIGNNSISIPTSTLASGVYALKITSGNKAMSKIIVKN